jgi:ECF sigma factor
MPLVYNELHRIAQRYMSDEAAGHTLQATALVNEAYLRLIQGSSMWNAVGLDRITLILPCPPTISAAPPHTKVIAMRRFRF